MRIFQTLKEATALMAFRPVVLVPYLPVLALGLAASAYAEEGGLKILLVVGMIVAELWAMASTIWLVYTLGKEEPFLNLSRAALYGLGGFKLLLFFIVSGVILLVVVGLPVWLLSLFLFSFLAGVVLPQWLLSLLLLLPLDIFPQGIQVGYGDTSGWWPYLVIVTLILWALIVNLWALYWTARLILGAPAIVLSRSGGVFDAIGESLELSGEAKWRLLELMGLVVLVSEGAGFLLSRIPVVGSVLEYVVVICWLTAVLTLAYLRLSGEEVTLV